MRAADVPHLWAGEPLRAVIADDEPIAREGLRAVLDAEPGVEVVAEVGDGVSVVDAVRRTRPNVVFLDMVMPGLDGMGAAAQIRAGLATDQLPALVFVTAFDRYALRAFDVSAADYLLKPFDASRVHASLARVRERLHVRDTAGIARRLDALLALQRQGGPPVPTGEATPHLPAPGVGERSPDGPAPRAGRPLERFAVTTGGRTRVVHLRDVEWLEAADNYVRLHAVGGGGGGLVRETLRSLEERLDPERFVRVHRSAIVNIDRIRELSPAPSGDYLITLQSGATLTMSRTFRTCLLQRLR